jgi:hypothetical protein
VVFPSGFPTNIPYTFLFSPIRDTFPAHHILLDLIILNNLEKSTLYAAPLCGVIPRSSELINNDYSREKASLNELNKKQIVKTCMHSDIRHL